MIRFQEWPTLLHDYIESRRDVPFQWGVNDCVCFAAGAVEKMTGADLIGAPRWHSASTAARVLKALGGMVAVADERFERAEEAQRGDIGLVVLDDREFFGVIYPPYVVAPGEKHIVMPPASSCRLAWKVAR